MEQFYLMLQEILEVDEIQITDLLSDFESWDSLTTLSIIAGTHDLFGIILTAKEIDKTRLVSDLAEIVQDKINNLENGNCND